MRRNRLRGSLAALAVALLAPASSPAQQPAPAAASQPAAAETAAPAVGRDLVELHAGARAHLEAICDDYRRIKALQLSRIRDISTREAYDAISSVMPVLEPLDTDLLRRAIRDPRDIQAHKVEVERLTAQVEQMIELAARLLAEIETLRAELEGQETETTVDLAEIVSRPAFDPDALPPPPPPEAAPPDAAATEALAELAAERPDQPYRDLTAAMRAFQPDVRDLTREQERQDGTPPDLFRSSDDTGPLRRLVNLDDQNYRLGRRITDSGDPVEWLFIDTWYTIGPFPNPLRVNLNTRFPPETVIDLDATYPGKDGRAIRWEFVQAAYPTVVPANPEEYAVYYAYTEVWLDQPMDLWVAIGSDDKANVWLNGLPIWISGDQLKGWRVNEGFRKVAFHRGLNRIIYRVENGHLVVAFSFGIRVAH